LRNPRNGTASPSTGKALLVHSSHTALTIWARTKRNRIRALRAGALKPPPARRIGSRNRRCSEPGSPGEYVDVMGDMRFAHGEPAC